MGAIIGSLTMCGTMCGTRTTSSAGFRYTPSGH